MSAALPLDDFAGSRRWVLWRNEPREGDPDKLTKVPYQPSGRKASSTAPATWVTRAKAEAAVETIVNGAGGGIGIVLGKIDDETMLAGIDLDTCRREDGPLDCWAATIIGRFATYTEISPSGRGAKLFFRVNIADFDAIRPLLNAAKTGRQFKRAGGDHPPGFEVYFLGRYFAVTEQHFEGTPDEIATIGVDDLRWLLTEAGQALTGKDSGQKGTKQGSGPRDDSRSAAALRLGVRMRRAGADFDAFREALKSNPETADWYREKGSASGERELHRIWEKAERQPAGPPWNIDPRAPYDTARLLLRVEYSADDGSPTLCRHRGGFYAWNGTAFPEITDAEIRAKIYSFLDQCVVTVTDSKTGLSQDVPVRPNLRSVNDVADALRAVALLPDIVAAPAWLDDRTQPKPGELMVCANGLLHLPTRDLLPHSPAFFTQNALDYAYDPAAPQPVLWRAFLNQLWPDDAESIATLRQIFGYCLSADTSQQKAFLIVGPKRSGKGTIARVLARLIGVDSAVAPTLAGLGTNFGLQPLIGKRVAIVSDARLGGRENQAVIAERLLSITGEDAITIDRKYREAWTGRLGARFLVLTNELPRLADASGALASRFIVLMLTESFYGREDQGLTDKLLAELPGILNWAIEGWSRLRRRGHFAQPASTRDVVEQLENLGSPVGAFVADRCEVGPGKRESVGKMFREWRDWCEAQGRDKPGTSQSFGRDLRAAVPGMKMRRHTTGNRFYEGISLRAM